MKFNIKVESLREILRLFYFELNEEDIYETFKTQIKLYKATMVMGIW